jgi:uncharacterized protein (DUF2384 family)
MTFEDDRTKGTNGESVEHVAEWLEVTLGPRLTAYAVGVSASEIVKYAHGDDEPAAEVEERLRNVYEATWFVASTDGPGSAHDWLMQPNPKLENRAPADLLREGEPPRAVWFSAAPVF